jgi:hypothetical protein
MVSDLLVAWPAVFFLGMGLFALARPDRIVDRFGTDVTTLDGRGEVRAVYGGFGIAVAAVLFWSLLADDAGRWWVPLVVAVATLGMAAGRLMSLVLDRTRGSALAWRYLALEVAIAVSLWVAATTH